MNRVLKLFAFVLAVFAAGFLLEELLEEQPFSAGSLDANIETVSDIFPVFVSLSIFAMTWIAYGKSRDNHSLFLGMAFLVIGLIDLSHVLSYPFMPNFITPNSFQKAGILHSEARLVSAVLFLAGSYVYRETMPVLINRTVLFAVAALLSLISIVSALFYPDSFPSLYPKEGISQAYSIRLFLTTVIILYAGYRYAKRIKETGESHLEFLIYGFIFLIVSDLVYFQYEISGHLLKLTAFVSIHTALYRSSVEMPYEKLAEAEDRLRMAAEERYRNLFDNASDAMITLDLEERITSWNHAAEKIFGWKAQDVIGEKVSNILIPGYGQARKDKIIGRVLSGGAISGIDVVCPHRNGTALNVSMSVSPLRDANQNIIGMSGILRDITERKRTEENLKLFSEAVEAAKDGIQIVGLDGRIIYSNTAVETIYGYRPEEMKRKHISEMNADPDYADRHILPSLKERGQWQGEINARHRNGGIFQVFLSASVIKNDKNEPIAMIGVIRDLTERKKAEAVRFENERLAAASRAKSEFLANMSHELRTPLNSIMGFSELLNQRTIGEMNEKQGHYLENIIKSSKHLLGLINDILDLSKVEAGKVELVIEKLSVPALIEESLLLIKESSARHNIIIKKELDPDIDTIQTDRLRFKQIMFNLLSNAVKFSKPAGGTVTVSAKKEGDMIRISVTDTGIGIKEEDMGRLFREFEQLDSGISRNYGGTGLGLAISKKLVMLQGGKITAESKYGEGSTFTFFLPLVAKKSGENK